MQTIKIISQVNNLAMGTATICESFIPNSVYTQCVRWKRKPIWLPTAKTKVFRVPKRPVIPVEEREEIQTLYNKYRTYMSSLRFFMIENAKKNKLLFNEALLKQKEEEDFQACNAINAKWNAEVAKERETRLAEKRKYREEMILLKLGKREQRQKRFDKKIDMAIIKAKTEAPTFITAENIDTAIEECLANTINHNQAMDLKGNWYAGKYPTTPAPEETKKEIVREQ